MGHGSVWELGPAAEKVARKCLRLLDSKLGLNLANQDKIGYIQKQHSKKMQHEDSQGGRGDYVFLILFRLLAGPIQG